MTAPASPPLADLIAELRRLHEEATPAPWVHSGRVGAARWITSVAAQVAMVYGPTGNSRGEENAALIPAARNALPRLLLAAERAEGLATALEKILAAGPDAVGMMLIARAALAAYRGSAGGGTT